MTRVCYYLAASIILQLIVCRNAIAQHAFYFELLGNGGLYSLNYERRINEAVAARAGFAFYTSEDQMQGLKDRVFTVPLLVNYYLNKNERNHVEVGAGLVLGNDEKTYTNGEVKNEAINSATGFIGYRHQQKERGFLWRIGLTPLYSLSNKDFWLSAGFSFGYHF